MTDRRDRPPTAPERDGAQPFPLWRHEGAGLTWTHLALDDARTRGWLSDEARLPPGAVEALLDPETRPSWASVAGDGGSVAGAVVILRGVNLNPGADPADMISVRLWLDERRVIGVQLRPLIAVRSLQTRLDGGGESGGRPAPDRPGALLAELSAGLFERMAPTVHALRDAVDDLEERLIEDPGGLDRSALAPIRRGALIFRRFAAPQRDTIADLSARGSAATPWLGDDDRRSLAETAADIARLVEELETTRDRAAVVGEELDSHLAQRTERTVYRLTIIATVFLPASFVTGLLGINVAGIPGSETPIAFAVVTLAILALVVVEVWLLRRLRWL